MILEGEGRLEMGDETISFRPRDFLFTPSGVLHRFFDFDDSFKAWLVFYDFAGGERVE